jgi:hypothetical protein
MSEFNRFNDQFRETTEERNDRLRRARNLRTMETLWTLIADLSDDLRDEGCDWSADGLEAMRRRCANALPKDKCPDWLEEYRDPPVVQS